MKKVLVIALSVLFLLSAAACRKQPVSQPSPAPTVEPTDAPAVEPSDVPDTEPSDEPDGGQTGDANSLSGILESMYGKTEGLELTLAPTTAIDLSDANAVKTYLGLDAADGVTEAVFSEPMMSSVAYSVCLVRVSENADKAALMRAMVDGVDPRKWICVEAESVSCVSSGDLVLLVMTEQALSDKLTAAFAEVMGASTVSAPVVRGK